MAKKPSSLGQVRIIGGQWRGRKLPVIDSPGLRPTTDRIKETVFNWLAPQLPDARCLDCFAGSGALGFEAISRYAREAVLLEAERVIVLQLKKNVTLLKTEQVQVIHTDALQWLGQQGAPFDIVFIDPPFREGMLEQTIHRLEHNHWLSQEAWIYVETEVEKAPVRLPDNWQLQREKVAGQVAYRLYYRRAESSCQGSV